MTTSVGRAPVVWIGAAIGIVMAGGTLLSGGSWPAALLAFAIVVGFALGVTLLAGRSEIASVLAGRPVDERWEHMGLEASAVAFALSSVATLGGLVVTEVTGGSWQPYAFVAVAMAVSYLGSLLVIRARH